MPRNTIRVAVAGLVVGMLAVAPRAAQQSPVAPQARPPVFRSTSELVEIDAVVTDRSGAIVRGLSRDDFQVTEDGTPQDIAQFSFVDIPMPRAGAGGTKEAPAARPDVSSNAKPVDSRLYVIVLDGFHVDASRSTVVRKLARQFIEDTMGPNDMAALMILGRNIANQQFTSDKALLTSALDQFVGLKSESAAYNILQDALLRPQHDIPEDVEEGARATEARIMLESIKQLCQSLGATQGHRRAVVLFSEGLDFDTTDLIGADQRPGAAGAGAMHQTSKHASLILSAQQDMFVAARRANVAIYTVDPRGNTMGEDTAIRTSSAATASFLKETQRSQGALRTFAEQTGGLAVVGTNNIAAGFTNIAQANSSYYVLAYSPTNTARDGAYHKISVSVKPSHLDVTARKGYYAPVEEKTAKTVSSAPPMPGPNAASPRMRELLASSLPVSGLGLRVSGGPVRTQGGKVLVALVVEIDTKDLPFAEKNGMLSNDIEMAFLAMDASGKMQAANRSVGNLRLPVAERSTVTNGLRYVVEFPAPPGRYQVRVAAHESEGGAGGSALFDVDALDLAKTSLSIGTILLTSSTAAVMPTTGSFPVMKGLLTTPPTASREFATTDTIVAFANVADADPGKPQEVEITTTVQGTDGREAFRSSVKKAGQELAPATKGYGHVSRIALSGFAPGRYVMTIDAKAANGRHASRSLSFVVR